MLNHISANANSTDFLQQEDSKNEMFSKKRKITSNLSVSALETLATAKGQQPMWSALDGITPMSALSH